MKETGCNGMCYREPLLEVIDESRKSFMYGEVTPDKAIRIIDEHVLNGTPVSEWVVQERGALGGRSVLQEAEEDSPAELRDHRPQLD